MRGIYIHIPFCVRKCAYCDFYSLAAPDPPALDRFCASLVREMDLFRAEFPSEADVPADTVYFGGGTPTVLGPARLAALLDALRERFPIAEDAEVTTEANPGTVSTEEMALLGASGFNRVSLGVQSFRAETLATLGRIHRVEEVRAAYRAARAARFASVGLDLIFGIPGQRCEDWLSDLTRTATFLPEHVSAYALSPEAGTPIRGAIERGEMEMPPDDAVAGMYEEAQRSLARVGYRQYEISNFARGGAVCRHNLKYWRREGYLGLGPSAHGLIFPASRAPLGLRTANPPSLAAYSGRIEEGRLPWADVHICDREDAWKESLIGGLRLTEGVDLAEAEERNGPPPDPVRKAVDRLVAAGRLLRDRSRLRLPVELFFVSNEVLSELV